MRLRQIRSTNRKTNLKRREVAQAIKEAIAQRSLHIQYKSGKWVIRTSNSSRPTNEFSNKRTALEYGKRLARRQHIALVVHDKDGNIIDSPRTGSVD